MCNLKCDDERCFNEVFLCIGVVRSVRPTYLDDCSIFMDNRSSDLTHTSWMHCLWDFPGMIHDERLNMYRRIPPVSFLCPNYSGDWLLHLLWNSPSLILLCPWSADHLLLIHHIYIPCVSLISNYYENYPARYTSLRLLYGRNITRISWCFIYLAISSCHPYNCMQLLIQTSKFLLPWYISMWHGGYCLLTISHSFVSQTLACVFNIWYCAKVHFKNHVDDSSFMVFSRPTMALNCYTNV